MIQVEPLVNNATLEVLKRMRLLGYRCFGIMPQDNSNSIQKIAYSQQMKVIIWQERKNVKGIEGYLARAQVVNATFTFLKIPLSFRFQETKEYVRKNQSKIDALALSFKEIRDLFFSVDTVRIAELIGRLRTLLLSTNVGLIAYSEAYEPQDLISPVAYEYLLYLILRKDDPLASVRIRKTLEKMHKVSI